MVDKTKLTYGLLDTNTGENPGNRKDWMCSDYIQIDGTENYVLTGFTRLRYWVGDADRKKIRELATDSYKPSYLVGGSYVRFTFPAIDAETIVFKHI